MIKMKKKLFQFLDFISIFPIICTTFTAIYKREDEGGMLKIGLRVKLKEGK
jgi:hypothetical protein